MTIGAYLYLIRGEEYKFPYKECVKSLLDFCGGVHVLCDPRFKDTELVAKNLSAISGKVIVHQEHLDLDNPGVDGKSKALARDFASSENYDWLIQMDADEIFRREDVPKVQNILSRLDDDIISCGQINWFNGNHIKLSSPISKERFSRNVKYITHGIPVAYRTERDEDVYFVAPSDWGDTDGAGYIDMGGNGLSGGHTTPMRILSVNKRGKTIVSSDFVQSLKEDIWIHHYSWYSIPHRWLREKTWNYFWGVLRGEYRSLSDYETRDGRNIDFFSQSKLKSPRSYYDGIANEMRDTSIVSVGWIKHPVILDDWRESVQSYLYGEKRTKLHRPFNVSGFFRRNRVVFE